VQEPIFGVVDLGSNTVHLLVARSDGQTVTPVVDATAGLRLGGDVDNSGAISAAKLEATLDTLRAYQEAATAEGLRDLHLLATHAIRVATKPEEVLTAIRAATGLTVRILAPEEEAALAFRGASAACPGPGMRAVVDIGGGSMQVAVGTARGMRGSMSLPLGAARVVARFLPGDPPSDAEEAQLVAYLAKQIPPALPRGVTPALLIGVGGMARRIPQLVGAAPDAILPADGLERALADLRGRTAAEIAFIYGMEPERARLMLAGILILRTVWREYEAPPLTIAAYGIREGAILQLAQQSASKDP
jgi:exopolyphosphatase/guanosine-5'-triphosphate,3'-diphosphate pyrophosphatase